MARVAYHRLKTIENFKLSALKLVACETFQPYSIVISLILEKWLLWRGSTVFPFKKLDR